MYRLDLVLNEFIFDAFISSSINILSDGTPWRPLIDVLDMCKLLFWSSISRTGNSYQVFNAGSNSYNYQVNDIASSVNTYFDNQIDVSVNPDAVSDSRSYQVDFSKLDSLIDPAYKPSLSLHKSISRVVLNLGDALRSISTIGDSSSLRRLVTLRKLISSGTIDQSLAWVNHSIIL